MKKIIYNQISLISFLLFALLRCSAIAPSQNQASNRPSWKWLAKGLSAWAVLPVSGTHTDAITELKLSLDSRWDKLDMFTTSSGNMATAATLVDTNGTTHALALQHHPKHGAVDFADYFSADDVYVQGRKQTAIQFCTATEQTNVLFFGGTTADATDRHTTVLHRVDPEQPAASLTNTFAFDDASTRLCQLEADRGDASRIWAGLLLNISNGTDDLIYTWIMPFYASNLSVMSLGTGTAWPAEYFPAACAGMRLTAPATGGVKNIVFISLNSTYAYNLFYERTYDEQFIQQAGSVRYYNYTSATRLALPKKIDNSVSSFHWSKALALDEQGTTLLVGHTDTGSLSLIRANSTSSDVTQYQSNETHFTVYGAQLKHNNLYISGRKNDTGFILRLDADTASPNGYYQVNDLHMRAVGDAGDTKPYVLGTTTDKKIKQFKLNEHSICLDGLQKKGLPTLFDENYVYASSTKLSDGTIGYNLSFENATFPWEGAVVPLELRRTRNICDCIGDTIWGWCIEKGLPGWSKESVMAGIAIAPLVSCGFLVLCCSRKCKQDPNRAHSPLKGIGIADISVSKQSLEGIAIQNFTSDTDPSTTDQLGIS